MVGCFDGRGFRELGFRVDVIAGLGACAPCVFQRLRQVSQWLDGELAQLVPRAGLTSAQTDAVIPAGTPLPSRSRSLKAEFRTTAQVRAPPPAAFAEKTPHSTLGVLTRQEKRLNRPKSRPRLHPNRPPGPFFCKRGN